MEFIVSGMEKIGDILDGFANKDFTASLTILGMDIEEAAKRNVYQNHTVNTGDLARSIESRVSNNELTVETNLEYAPYIEYGTGIFAANGDGRKDVPWRYQTPNGEWHTTSGIEPHPFLYPAYLKYKYQVMDYLLLDLIKE